MSDLLNQLLAQAAASDKQRQEVSAMQLAADEQKRMSVASKTEAKKQQVQANSINPTTDSAAYSAAVSLLSGYGKDSRTVQEQAVLNNPYDNSSLGFEEATRLFNARNRNVSAAIADTSAQRSGLSAIGDTTLDVARGAANMVAGPVALGAGLVNDNAGAALSQFIANTNAGVDSLQSDSLNSRRKFNQTANQLDTRDNQLQYQKDLAAGESDLSATLKREGRNALNAVAIGGSDAQILLSSTAQGVGSVLPVGTAANLISKATQGLGKVGGVVANNAVPIAVGAMEGGGAYQGTVAKAMGTSFDELSKTSPDFVSLVQGGMSPEDARVKLANSAGKTSAAIAGPAGAILGKLMPEFETLKLSKMPNASTAIAGIPKEGFEEGLQSWSGNLGQNTGIQQNVNPNQSLTEGAGKDIAEGVLSGMTTAGALSSPRLAASAVLGAANVTIGALVKRADKLLENNDKNNPVNIDNTAKLSTEATKVAPTIIDSLNEQKANLTPELSAKVDNLISAISGISTYDPKDYESYSPEFQKALSPSTTKVEEMLGLKKIFEDQAFSVADRHMAGTQLISELDAMSTFLGGNADAVVALPDSEPVKKTISLLQNIASNVLGSPQFIESAVKIANEFAAKHAITSPVEQLSDLTTPEGKQAAIEVATIAQYAPEQSDKKAIEAILEHNTAGLSPKQESSLRSAYTILDTFSKNNPKGELLTSIEDVTGEAVTNAKSGKRGDSAMSYLTGITDAISSGDTTTASAMLSKLSDFAQHFQNKANALNEASGKPTKVIKFDRLTTDGKWAPGAGSVGIHNTEGSLKTVTRIMREAEAIGMMYNSLVKQYPNLGSKPIALAKPDPIFLDQNNDGVIDSKALAKNMQWVTKPTEQPTKVADKPAPASDTAAKSEPAVEPKVDPSVVGSAIKSRITEEQAKRLSDAGLNDRLDRLSDKRTNKTATEEDNATFDLLVKEEDKRMTQAAAEIAAEEAKAQKKAEPVLPSMEELSDLPAAELQKSPDLIKRLWDLKKSANLLSKPFSAFGELWDTASNLLMMGTSVYSGNNVAKQNKLISAVSSPMEEFLELAGTKLAGASDDRIIDANNITAYIENRVNEIKAALNKKVEKVLTKDCKPTLALVQLLQANPLDYIRQAKQLPHRFPRYRLFSLLSPKDDSYTPILNDKMLELAAFAFTQWELSIENYKGKVEEKDVAALFGIAEEDVTKEQIAMLQTSTTELEMENTIGPMILKYWGLVPKDDMPVGYHEGIAKALAIEIAKSLAGTDNTSRIYTSKYNFMGEDGSVSKTVKLYHFGDLDPAVSKGNSTFSDLIEEVAFEEAEVPVYVGEGHNIPVATTVLRSFDQKLTDQQTAAISNEQKTPHYLNELSYRLYEALGIDNLYRLHGLPTSTEEELLNVNHKKTVTGQKKTLSAAFDKMQSMFDKVSAVGDVETTPIRYRYEVISTGRMQMLGAHNPQANKMMRHVILPTKDTVDLTNEQMLSNFKLAVAQGLGEKVHTMSRVAMVIALDKKLSTIPAQSAIKALQSWSADPSKEMDNNTVDWLAEFFDGGFTDAGLYALLEYTRYVSASPKELKSFTTSIYVEADGVTNGPAAAMFMIGALNGINQKWLANMARTGYFISTSDQRDPADQMTLNKARTADSSDLYGTTGNQVPDQIKAVMETMLPDADRVAKATLALISSLVPGISSVNGVITGISRSVAKNPLTTAMYGSGSLSTAKNIMRDAMDVFYEKLSNVAVKLADPDNISTEAELLNSEFKGQFESILKNFNIATAGKLRFSKDKGKTFTTKEDGIRTFFGKTFQDYSLNEVSASRLAENIEYVFAKPMKKAIQNETGTVVESSKTIIKATQLPSILMKREFMRLYDKVVSDRLSSKPDYQKSDGISISDLRSIEAEMRKKFPFIQTSTQSFDVSKSKRLPLDKNYIGATLDENTLVHPSVNVPQVAGVAGMPYLIIGLGDGRMMQFMAADPNGPTGTLKIFDGMHMKLSSMVADSIAANKAVWDAWHGNPFATIVPSFSEFLKNYDWKELVSAIESNSEEDIKDIGKSFGVTYTSDGKLDDDAKQAIGISLFTTYSELLNYSATVEATHTVLDSYQTSVDQMASVGAAYLHNVDGKILNMSATGLGSLNAEISELTSKLREQSKSTEVNISSLLNTDPVVLITTVGELLSKYKPKGATAALIKALTQVASATKVVSGSVSDIEKASGYTPSEDTNAFFDSSTGTIYLIDGREDTKETVLHETVHAATYGILAQHYANPSANPEIAANVARLEKLMERFMAETAKTKSKGATHARNAIESADTPAKKLNEFMAWGLSNTGTKNVLSKLATLAKEYLFKILNIAGIKMSNNMYQELVFETVSLMDKVGATVVTESAILQHNTTSMPGTNERIEQITNFFDGVLVDRLKESMMPGLGNLAPNSIYTTNPREFNEAEKLALGAGSLIGAHFPGMSSAELNAATSVVRAMATAAQLDGTAMAGVEKLYTDFSKGLKSSDFLLVPSDQATGADVAEANDMFNVIMGNFTTGKDAQGRNQLLPIFFALALTNERVRTVMANKAMKQKTKVSKDTLDDLLQSAGTLALEKLDDSLTSTTNSKNMQQAVDALLNSLVKSTEDNFNIIDAVSEKTGSIVDGANDKVLSAIKSISDSMEKVGNKFATSNNKAISTVGNFTSLVAKTLTDEKVASVAEGLLSAANSTDSFKPLRELVADFIGRTESNKLIYDMVKYVRSMVQQDRSHYREQLPSILSKKFSKTPTETQWGHLFAGLGKTDFGSLVNTLGASTAVSLLSDPTSVDNRIRTLESDLRTSVPTKWAEIKGKAEQLATFMNTGVAGSLLLRNAEAISTVYGGSIVKLDSLITLYALRGLEQPVKDTLSSLVQSDKAAIEFLSSYLGGLVVDEQATTQDVSINTYKGYIPSLPSESSHLIVASDTRHNELVAKSYVRLGDYKGSNAEGGKSRGYYFLKAPHRAAFSQGLMQNIHQTAGGIDLVTKTSINGTAGMISNPQEVAKITRRISLESNNSENLLPVLGADGTIIAYERSLNPTMLAKLEKDTHLAKMIGVWRGRQVEEAKAQEVNKALINNLKEMYDSASNKSGFINLFDSTDPIHQDALKLMPHKARTHIEHLFGKNTFMVSRSMINNTIGYRTPSIGDAWTGNSNWNNETLDTAKKIAISVFGNKAYEYLVNAEQILKNFIQDTKLIIVVKSVVVPVGNIVSNVLQLVARGVPLRDIRKGIPKKLSEVNFYTKQRIRKIDAEAELLSVKGDVIAERKLRNELDSIEDSFRRLSIWPLIEAGEFSAISDTGISRDDILLSEGRLHAYVEKLIDKFPASAQTVGKYGLVTKDTALFQGMQKAVEYGDFLAKALRYDHLISQGKTNDQAIAGITEEFVNYDLLMGRFREYGENIGMWWFTAFKIRSLKIAASIIRQNPVHALLSGLVPAPSGAGSPITDNILAKAMQGNLGYSLGLGQAFRAPGLNPWWNLAN